MLFVPSVAKADWRAFEACHERCWPKTQRYQFGTYTCKGQKAVNVYNTMENDGRFLRDLCKLTIMAICTDVEPLVAALLVRPRRSLWCLEATCVGGRLALFETEANCSVTGNPHIAKRYRAAKTPALGEVPGRHLLGSVVVTSVHQHTPHSGAGHPK